MSLTSYHTDHLSAAANSHGVNRFQCIIVYVPLTYPKYAASLFAANDFCRSAFAAAAILFAHPLFENLGIGRGISVLAGCSVLGFIGMVYLQSYGAALRAKSKFS